MIAFLSPAKNMETASCAGLPVTEPRFLDKTGILLQTLGACSPWQLESLLKISPELGMKAFSGFQGYADAPQSPALLSYHGLAYQSLDASSLSAEDLAYTNSCLRLFSAFYGPLRPMDAIRPYRLELACRLRIGGKNLYRFWGDLFYQDVFSAGGPVINLASAEYAKAVLPYLRPGDTCITCRFLVHRRGKWICLPTASKIARGKMARFLIKERLEHPDGLKQFAQDGYSFSQALSSGSVFTFLQDA